MTNYARVNLTQQQLRVFNQSDEVIFCCAINSAKNGVGCLQNSGCTPVAMHYVRAAIGAGLPELAVLKGRRPTGELWSHALAERYPERDWILGRILWLCGLEKNINRGGKVDTFRRFIYIHGSPDHEVHTKPSSHGCIRVTPKDMCALFPLLTYPSRVLIES